MHELDMQIYREFMGGKSLNSLAKEYRLEKSQIRKAINRVNSKRVITNPEVLHQLHDDKTG